MCVIFLCLHDIRFVYTAYATRRAFINQETLSLYRIFNNMPNGLYLLLYLGCFYVEKRMA